VTRSDTGQLFGDASADTDHPAAEAVAAHVRVAVERAVDRYPDGLVYAVPASLAGIGVGHRVVVPLGRGDRPVDGLVTAVLDPGSPDVPARTKPVTRVDDRHAPLPPTLVELARWISGYYCCPIGLTLAGMMPAAVRRGRGLVRRTYVDLEPDPPPPAGERPPRTTAKQRAVIEVLEGLAPERRPMDVRDLVEQAGLSTRGPIDRLVERGVLRLSRITEVEAAWERHAGDARRPESLTDEQVAAIEAIAVDLGGADAPGRFGRHVLFGVTGSGKTEVYVRLIERVLAAGRMAIVLVPEISLTPQTTGRLIGRLPGRTVAVLHSGLTEAQRHHQWDLVARGEADVVIGARSAVFAPVPAGRLGLIVVDEEHDGSYKQDQAPRYHGRDAAIRRAQLESCPVVLGSATPSLETWARVARFTDGPGPGGDATDAGGDGWSLHRLRRRAPGLRLPNVVLVDVSKPVHRPRAGAPTLVGPVLEQAIERTLADDGQVLLLLNRRGWASYLACADRQRCGWVMQCDHCDVNVVLHRQRIDDHDAAWVMCHHCQTRLRRPRTCPACGRGVRSLSPGTQRIEVELAERFERLEGGRALARVDSDAMHSVRDLHATLDAFGRGDLRMLVGTQMIAKGLDFAGVRLVGVLNADGALAVPDFRASERTFQLVAQVAGRAGRGRDPGLVIVQSQQPDMPAIERAAAHDFVGFAGRELDERRSVGLPPSRRLVRIVVRDEDERRGRDRSVRLADDLASLAEDRLGPGAVELRGPVVCTIARIAARHRWQVELLADTPAALQRLLAAARTRGVLRPDADTVVDVDPTTVL